MAEDKLVGLAEIARAFKIQRNSAWRWSRRPDFPEPVAKLDAGPVFRLSDVERWYADHRPAGGRPPQRGEH